jgi:hypothetical protein
MSVGSVLFGVLGVIETLGSGAFRDGGEDGFVGHYG